MRIPFVGPTYQSESVDLNSQRCINWYPVLGGPKGKNVVALRGTPGLNLWSSIGGDPIRGWHHVPGKDLYVVAYNQFYVVNRVGIVTAKGTINTTSGTVSMDDNGTEIMIVDGTTDGWIYDTDTDTFAEITDADFIGGDTVVFLDGYFIVNQPGTGIFQINTLYDGFTWAALDIASAERSPDKIVALFNSHGQLWVYGRYTIEVFYNSGASFPFVRMGSVVIEDGLSARWSLARIDNAVFCLSRNEEGEGMVKMFRGYQGVRVSTYAIEEQINKMSNIEDAVGYGYQEAGHTFYVLTFPTGNKTFVYDLSTGMWHERSGYLIGRHRGQHYVFFTGKHLISDYANGNIYEMRNDVYDDNGDPLIATRRAPVIFDSNNLGMMFLSDLQIEFESGVGISTSSTGQYDTWFADGGIYADGSRLAGGDLLLGGEINPAAMLRVSRDGGHVFGNDRWAAIGKRGEYKNRARWTRLGRSRKFVLEVSVSDPVQRTLIGATAQARIGSN